MYNGLVERCFNSCVESFRRKTLEKSEETARLECCELSRRSRLPSVRHAVLREVPEAQRTSVRAFRGAEQ